MTQNVNYFYTIPNLQPVSNPTYNVNYPNNNQIRPIYYIVDNTHKGFIPYTPNNNTMTIKYDSLNYNNNQIKNPLNYNQNTYRINNNAMANPMNNLNTKNQINLINNYSYPNPQLKYIYPQTNNNLNLNNIDINNNNRAIVKKIEQPVTQTHQRIANTPKTNPIRQNINSISNNNNQNNTINNNKHENIKIKDNKNIVIKDLNNNKNNNPINPKTVITPNTKMKDNKINKQTIDNISQKDLISNKKQINSPQNKTTNNNEIQNETDKNNKIINPIQKNNSNNNKDNNINNNINNNNINIDNNINKNNIHINNNNINVNNKNQKEINQKNNINNSPQNSIKNNNQNIINQKNNINLPQNNKKEMNNKNINDNKQPNIATVTKITTDGKANLPTPTPIKKRPLDISDYNNIIYKEIGMINLGNTCFINSCLQVLIHCPDFIYSFFNQHKSINKNNTIISAYFYEVCLLMMDTVNTQAKYIDITNFKNVFGKKHPTFGEYLQNDSQEFCRVLLEDISNELNTVKNKALYRELTNTDRKTKAIRDKEFDQNFKGRELSIITELFYSQTITTFTCECKASIYSFQKLLDFPLLLKENIKTIDIMELLKIYFQDEIIDFERKCENCQKVLKHKKEIKISRPPEILILSLQRIDPVTQKKNQCVVTFPKVLDISEFIDHELGRDKQPFYDLFAVVNHYGNIESGHYFSYIKFHQKEDWYEFNDSIVRNIGKNIESFPYAYALFYIKNKAIKK